MSSDYAPQHFGLVKLGSDGEPAAAESDATPEDILFEEGPASQSAAAMEMDAVEDEDGDGGWGALRDPSGHFESVETSSASPEPKSQSEPEPTAPIGAAAKSNSRSEPKPPAKPVRQRPRPAAAAKDGHARARPPRIPAHRMPLPHRPSGWMVPILVFTLSAGVSAIMFLFFQNLPMAGLAMAMGMIGSLFTRILLR